MLVFPNAKINLGLEVTGRRPDGYHNIETVMLPVQVRDALEFVPASDGEDKLEYSGVPIPEGGSDNIVISALKLLRADFDIPPLRIFLHKTIPTGAGMGGGSADGAFMLSALNAHFGLGLNQDALESLAARLGSDCPFFILNRPAAASGRGEVLEPVKVDLKGCILLLVYPSVHISTARAYASMQPKKPAFSPADVIQYSDMALWKERLMNRFEEFAFSAFPEIKRVKAAMYTQGATYASMTGSGSAVYGIWRGDGPGDVDAIAGTFGHHLLEM